ncbi:SusC/RagA family TonB-linked outer membrane protein [Chitinophaga sp. 22321]|uniref:SusC/RagA family TonB-linked outer membrane protein n=1 Tax=Chitinophaga hostae TaxID=2831022 RepID=A0ABS5IY16_9BACT|nr:SusC/RagA family TonB-linked outer membrane protein [Chitinophaga hostae]MBS0027681.1 SusC/RagA family TonB-linked outer membrane protein [Chitinophaga hostae]
MRFAIVLFIAVMTFLSVTVFAQKITISKHDVSLSTVLKEIKLQSGYTFVYRDELLKEARLVSIQAKDEDLKSVLVKCFAGQPFSYEIKDKTIIVTKKEDSSIPLSSPQQDLITISGQITDSKGNPLYGVSVGIKGGNKGTQTDNKGMYAISVDKGNTLVYSFIGFVKKEMVVDAAASINIVLQEDISKLEQVIVTGYSVKKSRELTGSTQRISGEEIRKSLTSSDPAALLKGKLAGLYISEQNSGDPTSKGGQIFVRGQSSIAGVGVDQYNEFVLPALSYGPLLVLDGVIMPNQNLKDIVTAQEVEEITVLKDASASAIYGSRAAAGVIVITTKKGAATKPRISADLKYGINAPNPGTIRFLSGQQLYDLQKEYYTQDYQINNASLISNYPTLTDYLNYKLPTPSDVANSFDWTKYALRNSNTTEVNLSASGGNDRTRYYMGGTYYNEQSTGIQNGIIRKSFRINLDSRLTDRLTASVAVNGILIDGKMGTDGTASSLVPLIPWASPYNADGSIKPFLSYKMDGSLMQADNPLFNQQYNFRKSQSQLIFGSLKLTYRINDWLDLSTTNSGNLNFNKNVSYYDVRTYTGGLSRFAPQGFLGTVTGNIMSYLSSNQLNFHKTASGHAFHALVGMEFGKTTTEFTTTNVNHVRAGYPVISLGSQIGALYDFSAFGRPATKTGNVEGGTDVKAMYSLFGELGYTYLSRYSLSGSVRTDASSSFGRNNRYGTFYSAGTAWIISEEAFMKKVNCISNLKLRANYGTSGSQLGDNFLTQTLYDPSFVYNGTTAAKISVLGNPDLKWEVTKTLSTGVEMGLFNRVSMTMDLYRRRSENLLQKVQLASVSGFPSQWKNVATVVNKGLEVVINSDNIINDDFKWNSSFNISFNKNEIISVANGALRQGYYAQNRFYLYPGDDINTLKAVKYAGVDPQSGKPQFEKLLFDNSGKLSGIKLVNSLGEVDAVSDNRQFQKIGSFQPRYFGGLTNTFAYRQFSLSILLTYAMKYTLRNGLAESYQGARVQAANQIEFLKNQVVWTTPGQTNATIPKLYYHNNTSYFGSDTYMFDASNITLRNIRLSYDLPKKMLRNLKLANCTFYLSGDNLYTYYVHNIVALNPEGPSVGQAQDFGGSGVGLGIPRKYLFGIQLTF